MLWPFPNNTRITAGFNESRPLAKPGAHKHGAIDIGLKVGSQIIAPEIGMLFGYIAIRPAEDLYWPSNEITNNPYKNYFYDMFGGILILKGESGITHIFAHLYGNQLLNKIDLNWKNTFKEEKESLRFPLLCFQSKEQEVFEGADIGVSGNAGYSTSAHCHYEMHNGFIWQKHEVRPNPEKIDWEY